jgi:hypothetical protein
MAGSLRRIALDAAAGDVSAELLRHGIAADAKVHVVAEVIETPPDPLPMAALLQEGQAFDWLAEEPDLYTDADAERQG